MARSPRAAFVGVNDARLVQVLREALHELGVAESTPAEADLVLAVLDGGAVAPARKGAGSVPVLAVVLPFATGIEPRSTPNTAATWSLGEPLARFRELVVRLLSTR